MGAHRAIGALPFNPLPPPGAVFIDGLRLPFFAACISVQCVLDSVAQLPPRATAGTFDPSRMIVSRRAPVRTCRKAI